MHRDRARRMAKSRPCRSGAGLCVGQRLGRLLVLVRRLSFAGSRLEAGDLTPLGKDSYLLQSTMSRNHYPLRNHSRTVQNNLYSLRAVRGRFPSRL